MTWDESTHGWVRLANGFDVHLRHGIPDRLSDNGNPLDITLETLVSEIAEASGLEVTIGAWDEGEGEGEREAPILVGRAQFAEVLQRLALASAALFVDRFNKAIDTLDVDWDAAEYASDFDIARHCCGLEWGDVDKDAHFEAYAETMHRETRRLAASPVG